MGWEFGALRLPWLYIELHADEDVKLVVVKLGKHKEVRNMAASHPQRNNIFASPGSLTQIQVISPHQQFTQAAPRTTNVPRGNCDK